MGVRTWRNRFVNCHEPLVGGGLLTSSMTSRLQERREISPSWPLLMHTHIHEVRGTGREDHVPARAVTDIEERG